MISKRNFRLRKNGEPYSECFCRSPELIENYDLAISDKAQVWEVHHRLESCFTQKFLKEMGLYYDVEPAALIFLTKDEHNKIDSKCRRSSEVMKNHKSLSKKVLCVETGEIFDSTMDAQRKTGIFSSNISAVCRGKLKTTGGFHWAFAS